MLIDLNQYPSSGSTSGYDACIVGAGVAGITLAIKLGKAGKKVALLEAGGLEFTEQSQDVYAGKSTDIEYSQNLQACRLRFFGGTSNHWGGTSIPYSEVDFVERDFFGLPGWPIPKSELDKYLEESKDTLDINGFTPLEIPDWDSELFNPLASATSPTRFGQKYQKELEESKNIDLFINANLTDIQLSNDMEDVIGLTVKNYNNNSFLFSGKTNILSMGGIENPRLLLNSDSQAKNGIGNNSDFVGRCFMEHYLIDFGYFVGNKSYWEVGKATSIVSTTKFSLENKIGSSNIDFWMSESPHAGYGRKNEIKRFFRDNICRSDALAEFSRKFVDFPCPGNGSVSANIEQSPNKDSRITLNNDKDSFDLRRVDISWTMSDLDKRTIRASAMGAAKEFARLDYGRVKLADYLLDEDMDIPVIAHCHHIGTTRMSATSEFGVVDKNCKVFGINNLFVAGSSVFSTGGHNNPTFPIVQMSLRLADHLASKL
ncbi:MAG TPA: GMC family oxidoreductase [Chromatiales bacterium]|nr:GMC family oxidoreductase [Thiotrichales bacterium]HIP67194.1 GMC family oxidoreductase [Chromatiales bacterium]